MIGNLPCRICKTHLLFRKCIISIIYLYVFERINKLQVVIMLSDAVGLGVLQLLVQMRQCHIMLTPHF